MNIKDITINNLPHCHRCNGILLKDETNKNRFICRCLLETHLRSIIVEFDGNDEIIYTSLIIGSTLINNFFEQVSWGSRKGIETEIFQNYLECFNGEVITIDLVEDWDYGNLKSLTHQLNTIIAFL